jgi:hypothetical protein
LELTRAESAVVVATAADDGGVSRVELWVGTDETCHLPGGLASGGPGSLVTKPRAFTDAAISATEAPSRLSTTVTLGNQQVRANCTVYVPSVGRRLQRRFHSGVDSRADRPADRARHVRACLRRADRIVPGDV